MTSRISSEMAEWLDQIAADRMDKPNMTQLVREAIAEYIKNYQRKKNRRLQMLQRLLHRWFGWHFYIWEMPQDDHDTCWICGAKRERDFS